jgi:hypothetical protein
MRATAKSLCPRLPAGFTRNLLHVYGSQRKSHAAADAKQENPPEEGVNEK